MFGLDPYATLFKFARALETPRARALHETARRFELHVLAPSILSSALAPWRNDVRFHFRHSVREPGEFNFLLSDVDFDLVLERGFSADELARLRKTLAKTRSLFRFLGETEIFTKEDHLALKNAEAKAGRTYGFIRLIRKLRWMDDAAAASRVDYHRFKAERSNSITRKKLRREIDSDQPDLSTLVTSWLDREFPSTTSFSEREPIWVDYLGYWLTTGAKAPDAKPALVLSEERIATLASLVPDIFHGHPDLLEAAKARRQQDSRLLEAWHQMVTIEEMRQRAWGRAQDVLPRDYEGWVATLAGWRRSINA